MVYENLQTHSIVDFDNIHYLLNPTLAVFKSLLNEVMAKIKEGRDLTGINYTILFFVSGHGY